MTCIVAPGRNAARVARAARVGILVDARDYYRAFYQAMCGARSYALLAGWQFDSDVRLLRGEDAEGAPYPVELLPFLSALCRERSELHVSLLAWDYSVVYTFEREWLQRLKFDFGASERIHYLLDGQHPVGASHHQKLVVVDGHVAFVGGADICDGRWDDPSHTKDNPGRVNRYGEPYKPYHEVVAVVSGRDVVGTLEHEFVQRWQRAAGAPLSLPPPPEPTRVECEHAFDGAHPLAATATAVARTYPAYENGTDAVAEIRRLYEDAIGAADHLVYIETQYITSRALLDAFLARFRDSSRSRLRVVIVLPRGSDTFKEQLALGAAEDRLLATLRDAARQSGHELRLLYSESTGAADGAQPTFIHSKLLVIDDRFLTVGSANCTNRSFGVDSELNLVWESVEGEGAVSRDIARLRAKLLAEHAGIEHDERLEDLHALVEHIDALLEKGTTRLRRRPVPELSENDLAALVELAFDPEGPMLERALEELFGTKNPAGAAPGSLPESGSGE